MKFLGIRINIHHYVHWIYDRPKQAKRIFFCLRPHPNVHVCHCQEITNMNLNVGQSTTVDLVAKTASGGTARVDTSPAPEYSNSNPAVISLGVAPDGLSVVVTGLTPGSSDIGCRADADLRPGQERFLDAVPLNVSVAAVEEEAATIELVERL